MRIIIIFFLLLCWSCPSFANVKDDIQSVQVQYDKSIEISQDAIKRTSSLELTRTQTSEILRGKDLSYAVEESQLRTQNLINNQKEATKNIMSNKQNANEAKNNMAKDMIERNRIQQQDYRNRQKEMQQMMRDRSR